MSGIASGIINMSPEFLVNDGQMNVYLGQGQTSHVLRNLCYKIIQTSKDDWKKIARFLELLFQVKLQAPELDETTSVLSLSYLEYQSSAPLEIALAGRGMQQVLLILAYLYSHKNSVLMIDEPDAHLELLRQKQIFTILQDVALQTDSQIIIATHSEVILDESVETNLSFILNGECIELSRDDVIKHYVAQFRHGALLQS
jgi:ABC-type glutathione transport system ATPase component